MQRTKNFKRGNWKKWRDPLIIYYREVFGFRKRFFQNLIKEKCFMKNVLSNFRVRITALNELSFGKRFFGMIFLWHNFFFDSHLLTNFSIFTSSQKRYVIPLPCPPLPPFLSPLYLIDVFAVREAGNANPIFVQIPLRFHKVILGCWVNGNKASTVHTALLVDGIEGQRHFVETLVAFADILFPTRRATFLLRRYGTDWKIGRNFG